MAPTRSIDLRATDIVVDISNSSSRRRLWLRDRRRKGRYMLYDRSSFRGICMSCCRSCHCWQLWEQRWEVKERRRIQRSTFQSTLFRVFLHFPGPTPRYCSPQLCQYIQHTVITYYYCKKNLAVYNKDDIRQLADQTANITKDDITLQHIATMSLCCEVISSFVIFLLF